MGIFPHSCYLVRFSSLYGRCHVGIGHGMFRVIGELRLSCTIKVQATSLTTSLGEQALITSRLQDGYAPLSCRLGEYLHIIIVRYAAAALATNPEKS